MGSHDLCGRTEKLFSMGFESLQLVLAAHTLLLLLVKFFCNAENNLLIHCTCRFTNSGLNTLHPYPCFVNCFNVM